MSRGQSFVEYTLLVAVALIGLLVIVDALLEGSIKSSAISHFDQVSSHITGN